MFYSQTLLSKKGPLGAIRVAAYFFKRLKKPHVQDTDIPSSVDKILQDEMPVLTYRVLGYLLLGIVRIYSKKVEYLFDDCQEVLIGVNNFAVHTKEDLLLDKQRAPFFSITLPESFELDAFDLEVHDVDDTIGGNVLPHEEITLKDNAQENAITTQYASDMCFCDEFSGSHNTWSANYVPVEGVVSSYWMDVHLRNSINIDSLIASVETLQENRCQEECVNLRMICAVEKEPQNADKPYDEDNQDNREKIEDPQILSSKDGIQGVASAEKLQDCGENGVNLLRSSGIEGGPADRVRPDGEDISIDPQQIMFSESELLENETCLASRQDDNLSNLQAETEKLQDNTCSQVKAVEIIQPDGEDVPIDPQQIMVSESEQLENETCPVSRQDDNRSNLQAETEKLRDNTCSQVEAIDIVMSEPKEPEEHVEPLAEENQGDGDKRLPEMLESIKSHTLGEGGRLSIEVVRTPHIKVPDALGATTLPFTSIRTPDTKERSSASVRAATPQSTSIPTPVTKERARISRKRKCVYDDIVVLPNNVLKASIHDASDLVSKRRKVGHTALSVWRASRMFHHGFFEPLLPCVSSELRSLFSEKKLKIRTSVKSVEPPKELDIPERPTVGISEQMSIAPETPVQRPTLAKSLESPMSPQTPNCDRGRPELFEILEQEPASIRDQEPAPTRDQEPAPTGDQDPAPTRDQELYLSLIDEVINSSVEDNNELDGWTGRTRKVARYLHRRFLDQKERGEEEVVNLSRVVNGRTKKESARFFYEILVLSSKGHMDVKQDDGYGDILVRKLRNPDMEPNL